MVTAARRGTAGRGKQSADYAAKDSGCVSACFGRTPETPDGGVYRSTNPKHDELPLLRLFRELRHGTGTRIRKTLRRFAFSTIVLGGSGALTSGTPAYAAGVQAGVLTCHVSSGFGFIFGSSRELNCIYAARPGSAEHYTGVISKFGLDIGYLESAVMTWDVVPPAGNLAPGSLAGDYTGPAVSASVGVGVGANILLGGSNDAITLQPLTIGGNTGLNVAAGIGAITLSYRP
jgi:hypothetical protein